MFDLRNMKQQEARKTLHNEKLHNLHCSPNVGAIKLKWMWWAGNVACMEENRREKKCIQTSGKKN
jgi:hypothetical protein